jgi:hypothetical protein
MVQGFTTKKVAHGLGRGLAFWLLAWMDQFRGVAQGIVLGCATIFVAGDDTQLGFGTNHIPHGET